MSDKNLRVFWRKGDIIIVIFVLQRQQKGKDQGVLRGSPRGREPV